MYPLTSFSFLANTRQLLIRTASAAAPPTSYKSFEFTLSFNRLQCFYSFFPFQRCVRTWSRHLSPGSIFRTGAIFSPSDFPPSNRLPTPFSAGSMAMSDNLWITVTSGGDRIILWDSTPDMCFLGYPPYPFPLSNPMPVPFNVPALAFVPRPVNAPIRLCFNGTSCEVCA